MTSGGSYVLRKTEALHLKLSECLSYKFHHLDDFNFYLFLVINHNHDLITMSIITFTDFCEFFQQIIESEDNLGGLLKLAVDIGSESSVLNYVLSKLDSWL